MGALPATVLYSTGSRGHWPGRPGQPLRHDDKRSSSEACVLRALGGAGYTFGAFAHSVGKLTVVHSGHSLRVST